MLALATAHFGAVAQELAPATGRSDRATGLIGRIAGCSHAQLALVLIGIAGLEWSVIHASLGQRLADLILMPAYVAGAVATWWLCFESAENLRLAAIAVAIVGVWLLG